MHISGSFERAGTAGLRTLLNLAPADRHDYLIVTGLDLTHRVHAAVTGVSSAYRLKLSTANDAHETMNAIAKWVRGSDALDQRFLYGEKREQYNIGFYRFHGGGIEHPSLINDFYLEEYIFPDKRPEDAWNLDELMRMLDRDRMAQAMLQSLVHDFNMRERKSVLQTWQQDMRQACHPDHPLRAPGHVPLAFAA